MLTAFVAMLLLLSVNDLSAARVDTTRLVSHGFVILGWLIVVALSRVTRDSAQPPGDRVAGGVLLATVTGPARGLLTAERTALNLLCRLSGVATHTRAWADALAGTKAMVLDTRKTLPGLRALQKAAVRAGGGTNHRGSLSEGVLVEANHLGGVGIAEEWTGDAQDPEHWRDTHVRVHGPVVRALQGAFAENWLEATGEVLAGDDDLPRLDPVPDGDAAMQVIRSSAGVGDTNVETLYYLAIASARRRVEHRDPVGAAPERTGRHVGCS